MVYALQLLDVAARGAPRLAARPMGPSMPRYGIRELEQVIERDLGRMRDPRTICLCPRERIGGNLELRQRFQRGDPLFITWRVMQPFPIKDLALVTFVVRLQRTPSLCGEVIWLIIM